MLRQPKLGPEATSPLFADGRATRPPPAGVAPYAMGDAAAVSSARRGDDEVAARDAAQRQQQLPDRPGARLLARGQQRYTIYCVPCHSAVGDGDGMVVRRGFPAPPSYHSERLRDAPDRHFYDVISQGHGVMYPYADRISPQDRWAIVAYIRALQLSRHARLAALPDDLRTGLEKPAAPEAATAGAWHPVAPAAVPGVSR